MPAKAASLALQCAFPRVTLMPLWAAPAFLPKREHMVPTAATSRKDASAEADTVQAHAPQGSGPLWM